MRKQDLQRKMLRKLTEMKRELIARNRKLREEKKNRPGSGLAKLLEGELERAELTLNAQDIVNKLQAIAEDLAELSVQQVMPLADGMKGEFGPDAAEEFESSVGSALENALQTVRDAREQVNNSVLRLQGKLSDEDVNVPSSDMSTDDGSDIGIDIEGGDVEDAFGGEPAASGEEGEPLGRVRKESREYSSKKKSSDSLTKHETALVEAFVELVEQDNFSSLQLEVVADKYGVPEEELLEVYQTANKILTEAYNQPKARRRSALLEAMDLDETARLDEFLPLLGIAARGAAGLGGAALRGAAGLGASALRGLGKAAVKGIGAVGRGVGNVVGGVARGVGNAARSAATGAGNMARTAVGNTVGDMAADAMSGQDQAVPAPSSQVPTRTPAPAAQTPKPSNTAQLAKAKQMISRKIAQSPQLKKVASKLGVRPEELADLNALLTAEGHIKRVRPLKEHRILEDILSLSKDDAVRVVKERIKAVKAGKDLAVRETFPADVRLTTPRAVAKQLINKYGDPTGWSVAQSGEGAYYVLSSPIPESEKAKSLEGQITSLEEEITNIREKHKDVQEEYNLPQEIKVSELRNQLREYQTGYRHQVAKWLSLDEASALVSLAQAITPKAKAK